MCSMIERRSICSVCILTRRKFSRERSARGPTAARVRETSRSCRTEREFFPLLPAKKQTRDTNAQTGAFIPGEPELSPTRPSVGRANRGRSAVIPLSRGGGTEGTAEKKTSGLRRLKAESRRARISAQAGYVIGDRADLGIAHPRGDRLHHPVRVVPAFAGAERFQLRLGVLGVLPRQTRILRGKARSVRAVTGGARGESLRDIPAAPDFSAEFERVLVLQRARLDLLRGVIRGDIAHVLDGKRGNHASHDRVFPIRLFSGCRLEIGELLLQVFRDLTGEFRIGGGRTVAVGTVARRANLVGDALALGGICLGGVGGTDGKMREAGANRKPQKRQSSFHAVFLP